MATALLAPQYSTVNSTWPSLGCWWVGEQSHGRVWPELDIMQCRKVVAVLKSIIFKLTIPLCAVLRIMIHFFTFCRYVCVYFVRHYVLYIAWSMQSTCVNCYLVFAIHLFNLSNQNVNVCGIKSIFPLTLQSFREITFNDSAIWISPIGVFKAMPSFKCNVLQGITCQLIGISPTLKLCVQYI